MPQLSIYIRPEDQDLFDQARAVAKSQRRNLSPVIAEALEAWLKQSPAEHQPWWKRIVGRN